MKHTSRDLALNSCAEAIQNGVAKENHWGQVRLVSLGDYARLSFSQPNVQLPEDFIESVKVVTCAKTARTTTLLGLTCLNLTF